MNKGMLKYLFDVQVTAWSGMIVTDMTYWEKEEKKWVNFPCKVEKNVDGEKKYVPYIKFDNFKNTEKFKESALKSLQAELMK